MLCEVKNIKQVPGDPYRRLFTSPVFDLFVWYNENRIITGFQLSYRQSDKEHALTWLVKTGFAHNKVDIGEDHPGRTKMSPILVKDGIFHPLQIIDQFQRESANLDAEIVQLVTQKLLTYPE